MKSFQRICIALTLLTVVWENSAFCESGRVDYLTQVKPLLRERCFACHGALKQESGLRLDTAPFIKQGGDSGQAIEVKLAPEKSLLIERVSESDPALRMPPEFEGEPLSTEQINLLKKWIAEGAPAPADEVAEKDPRQHWAFQPVQKPNIPEVDASHWVRNPIDAWIALGQQQHGLTPLKEASRVQLLRRVSFDLIGLPPTAEEISACLNDTSPDWYEKVVDRLLADPRHGERWARHWMDIWRYSDWWGLGAQLRNSQQHIWHWRDWIVESLNDDTPYDEMVRLMLAADEIAPGDTDKLRATGFLARNYYIFNRMRWMDETVEHVSKGLLGLTMNCAKCHDHKFDPIDQVDFYKMRAFFEPYLVRMDMVPGEVDVNKDGLPRVFDALLEEPTYLYVRGDEARPDKSTVILPGVPELLAFDALNIQDVDLPPVAWQPARQPWVIESHVTASRERLNAALAKLETSKQALQKAEAAAAAAEENSTAQKASPAKFQPLKEDFTELNRERWKIVSGEWSHQAGFVQQSMDGQKRSILQLLQKVPQNFDATLRFRLLGGSRYRSVGIAFDTASAADRDPRFLVYASGYEPGQKVQAAYDDNGTWHYPGNGNKAVTLKLETDYTLRVQARGSLMNVSLNGEHQVAWRSPVPRDAGLLQLVTFDALARLQEFQISELSDDVELRSTDSKSQIAVTPVQDAKWNVSVAAANVEVAQAELKSIEARAEAMRASWRDSDASALRDSKNAAVKSERALAVAKAKSALVDAEVAVERAAAEKKDDAGKKLEKAKNELAKAEATFNQEVKEEDHFSPLAGAKWSATRFQHTGRDDPAVEFPETSTGRRSALANWITDRRNPLTARVAANHIWSRHFGQALVPTTFDFGRNGKEPTHPELLDWLAAELMDHGWSMKHLHKLIVTSSTYRMGTSTAGQAEQLAKDPDNHYWWRRMPIRLESQAVRDSVLALAGTLDETMGGPTVSPKDQEESLRRSLYFFHSNNEKNLLLTTFDEASVAECYQREQSVVPQQALALSNSRLVLESSQKIANQISKTEMSDEEFIRQAFLLLLGIEASPSEVADCQAAIAEWSQLPDATTESARGNLIWALINHNDFVTLR